MEFYPGFDISPQQEPFGFCYGKGVFGPEAEIRRLDDIRASLEDPGCAGPEAVYSISMDVGMEEDREEIEKRNLLYGAVTYAAGTLGREPVRSQGHIHAVSISCGSSTPEVYEIWDGRAIIYMQESGEDDPGACYAIYAGPGDVVIVPPYWVHATVNGGANRPMTFGAWCGGWGHTLEGESRLPLPWIDGEGTKGVYGIRNPQGRSGVRPVPGTEGPV